MFWRGFFHNFVSHILSALIGFFRNSPLCIFFVFRLRMTCIESGVHPFFAYFL
ncbi:hypothetical protein CSC32_3960 [Pseudomonas aeruginosa]|nr:hypothetical protein CSC32_3960 [Pseudomonas aeruginosa]